MKVTIIGTGNIGSSIARGLAQGSIFKAQDITCTVHSEASIDKVQRINSDFKVTTNNPEAVSTADIIFICVKPWRVEGLISEIRDVLDFKRQIVVSVAAGVTFEQLTNYLNPAITYEEKPVLFRVIPNTAIEVMSSMTFVSACNADDTQTALILRIFNELGKAMLVEERLMMAGTALASSGIAFALRYMRASIEGGVELGFYPREAQDIVVHTVKGAVDLLLTNKTNPEAEIDKVTTPGGITIKGLNQMEVSGFTSSVIRGLKASK